MDGLDANSSYLTYCLTPVVSTAVESQTVSSLWGPLGVVGGVGVSGPLAQSASVAGGLESWGNDSGPAWVALGQDWSVPGVGLGVALADGVGEGAVAVVCDAELGQTGAGLMDESAAEGIGLSLTLAKSLWGPVAVGSTSWVKAGTSQSAVGGIGIEGVGGSQAQKR